MYSRKILAGGVIFCTLIIIFSTQVTGAAFFGEPQDEERIVFAEIDTWGQVEALNRLDFDILHRYDRYVLLEGGEDSVEALEDTNIKVDTLPNRTKISINGHRFDIEDGEPDLDPDLMIEGYPEGVEGTYLIHLLGPMSPNWREQLKDMDIEVLNYVPNHAYKVRMTPETKEDIEKLDFVDWTGVYHPQYKIYGGEEEIEDSGSLKVELVPDADIDDLKKLQEFNLETDLTGSKLESDTIVENEGENTIREIAKIHDVHRISPHQNQELPSEEDRVNHEKEGPNTGDYYYAVDSPYDDIDWDTTNQYKSAFHVHTEESDGRSGVSERIREHEECGFDVLSITDHDTHSTTEPTWRWSDFDDSLEEDWVVEHDGMEQSAFYSELGDEGMFAIKGNEISDPHHIGSFFNDAGWSSISEDEAIEYIDENDGLSQFYHPARYDEDPDWYIDFFDEYDSLLGHALFSSDDGTDFREEDVRDQWDEILTHYAPDGRHIWGWANSDVHDDGEEEVNGAFQIVLAEDHGEQGAIRESMVQGKMFWVANMNTYDTNEMIGVEVDEIRTETEDALVELDVSGEYEEISWIYDGEVLTTGTEFTEEDAVEANATYVRFEIHETNADAAGQGNEIEGENALGSQAFYLSKEEFEEYDLTIDIEGEGSTDPPEGTHNYTEGEEVTLTAEADEGWEFKEWTGDHQSTEEQMNVTMDDDKNMTAHFEEETGLSVRTDPASDMTSESALLHGELTEMTGYEETEVYFEYREEGEEVWEETTTKTLAEPRVFSLETTDLEPDTLYEFRSAAEADDDIEKGEVLSFTTEALETFELKIDIEGEGSTDPEEGTHGYEEGETVTVEATPAENWYFEGWIGDHTGAETTIEMTMDEDKSLTAVFEIQEYDLDISIIGEGSTDPSAGTHSYEHGDEVTIEAIPEEGWYFEEWTGDHAGPGEHMTIEMVEDVEITAHFAMHEYDLTIEVEGEGTVESDPEQEEYQHGTDVTLTAEPEEGWYFEEWTGDYEGTEEEVTITMDDDREVTAHFEVLEYNLTVEIEGEGGTYPEEGTHTYELGEEVVVEAFASGGWYFEEWTGDYEGTEEEITLTLDEDLEITAHFEEYEPAFFEVEILEYEEEAKEGEEINVKYRVTNTGELRDTQDITLYLDGEEVEVYPGLELGPGERHEEEFTLVVEEGGEQAIEIRSNDDESAGMTTVEEEGFLSNYWWLILVPLIGIIAVVVLIFWMKDHENDDEKEGTPEMPSPLEQDRTPPPEESLEEGEEDRSYQP